MFEDIPVSQIHVDLDCQRSSQFHLLYHQNCDQDSEQQSISKACTPSSSGATSHCPPQETGLFNNSDRLIVPASNGNIVNVVAKRNARERTRVHTVNQAFMVLKTHIPEIRSHTKRVSKLKILRAAINHIDFLVRKLKAEDSVTHYSQPFVSKSVPSFSMCESQLLNNPSFQPYVNVQTLLDYPSYIYPNASTTQQLLASHTLFLTQGYNATS